MPEKIYGSAVNDAGYIVRRCPFYGRWFKMLERCYSSGWHLRNATYIGCYVCEEWLLFSNFKRWMETQDWRNKQLDKDILGSGKLYSPETCCFIPQWLNKLFNFHGPLAKMTGVYKRRGKFAVMVRKNGARQYVGSFLSLQEASDAYKEEKIRYIRGKMASYPDKRIKDAFLAKFEEKFGNEMNLINSCKLVQLQPLQLSSA